MAFALYGHENCFCILIGLEDGSFPCHERFASHAHLAGKTFQFPLKFEIYYAAVVYLYLRARGEMEEVVNLRLILHTLFFTVASFRAVTLAISAPGPNGPNAFPKIVLRTRQWTKDLICQVISSS